MFLDQKNQAALLKQAAEWCGTDGWPHDSEAIGIRQYRSSPLMAVMVLNTKHQDACHIHFASDRGKRWATRSVFTRLFWYCFSFKKLDRMLGVIPAHNVPMQVMVLKLGFQIEGRLRCGAADGSDAILFSILKRECRWLKEQNNG